MNETQNPPTEEERTHQVIINVDANVVNGAVKGFFIGYFGVILLTGLLIAACFLGLILASAAMR